MKRNHDGNESGIGDSGYYITPFDMAAGIEP